MSNFIIITDTGCDISPSVLEKWDVNCIDLSFVFKGEDKNYTNKDFGTKQFYDMMRNGKVAQTSAANVDDFLRAFEAQLKSNNDILYLSFSSALSGTFGNATIAANELALLYPDRKIKVVDSKCASAGQGLLLYLATKKRDEGTSLDETAEYLTEELKSLCHWFTVNDLVYLKRGGRIDSKTAIVGTVLNIKPILHVDDDGFLTNVSKTRGRKNSINALAQKYTELANDPQNGTYFISHADCIEDAKQLESIIEKEHKNKATLITDIGPIIGAHAGPGTLALFFLGKQR